MRFAHVGLVVNDLERMREFYSRGLGMIPTYAIRRDGPWVSELLASPGADIDVCHLLHPSGLFHVELTKRHTPPTTRLVGSGHFSVWVDSIEDVLKRIETSGQPLLTWSDRPVEVPDGSFQGTRMFRISDPEGNTIQFLQAPGVTAGVR